MARALGDRSGEGHTRLNLSWLSLEHGATDTALAHAQAALALYEHTDRRVGHPRSTPCAGAWRGWAPPAARWSTASGRSTCSRRSATAAGQAATWDSLGYIHHSWAIIIKRQPATSTPSTSICDHFGRADTLVRLGDSWQRQATTRPRRRAGGRPRKIFDESDHPHAASARERPNRGHSRNLPNPPGTPME
jgi:hypothetical protein